MKRLLLMGALALALGAGIRVAQSRHEAHAAAPVPHSDTDLVSDQTPSPAAPGSRHPRWVAVWTRPTPDLCDVSLAPDGATVAWVDARGAVRRIATATGMTLWQSTPMPHVNGVVAASGGDVLAFSRLNPLDTTLHCFDVAGAASAAAPRVSALPIAGAIWSVVASPRGDRALVGTGQSTLALVPLNPATTASDQQAEPPPMPAPASIVAQGIPESLAVAGASEPGAAAIVAGTWQDAGVRAWSANGAPLWSPHVDPRPDQAYDVHVSADGSTVVAISSLKPRGTQPRIHIWDGQTGHLICVRDASDDQSSVSVTDARALVSANGSVIAVSYATLAPDALTGTTPTRRLALFNRSGNKLFADKGGRYFAPHLVALSADGADITVRDSAGSLRILDDAGRYLSHTPLAPDPKTGRIPTVRATFVSADGRYLLLQRGDGQITLFKAVAA